MLLALGSEAPHSGPGAPPSPAFSLTPGGVSRQPPGGGQVGSPARIVGVTCSTGDPGPLPEFLQDDLPCLCSRNLSLDARTHPPAPSQPPQTSHPPCRLWSLRPGWLAGSGGRAEDSDSFLRTQARSLYQGGCVFTGRLQGGLGRLQGGLGAGRGPGTGGDFELRAGSLPPLPGPWASFLPANMQPFPPHNASLCPEPPGTPVT